MYTKCRSFSSLRNLVAVQYDCSTFLQVIQNNPDIFDDEVEGIEESMVIDPAEWDIWAEFDMEWVS